MKKLVLGCALVFVTELAQADAYVSTYMTTECGFRGHMASVLNAHKDFGVKTMQETMYAWIKAVATSKEAEQSVMYPAFKSWYNNTNKEQMDKWVEKIATYSNPIEASTKERLACEKEKAGEQ
jgi:hypothetical protein